MFGAKESLKKKKKNSYSSREMHYITEINEKGYK